MEGAVLSSLGGIQSSNSFQTAELADALPGYKGTSSLYATTPLVGHPGWHRFHCNTFPSPPLNGS